MYDLAVISVGTETCVRLSSLLASLVEKGFRHLPSPSPEIVPDLLRENDKAAVLVYNARGTDTARRVLRALDAEPPDVPVVVVVEEGDFDEYYELMCQGAYDYFGLPEGMAVIEEAVRWAAQTGALSPLAAAVGKRQRTEEYATAAA